MTWPRIFFKVFNQLCPNIAFDRHENFQEIEAFPGLVEALRMHPMDHGSWLWI